MRLKPSTLPGSGYVVAVLATAAVTAFRVGLQPLLADSLPFLFFPVAIAIGAWYGGLGPGLAATVLSAAASVYLFIPTYYSFSGLRVNDWIGIVVFGLTGVIISWLCELLHVTRRKLEVEERRLQRSVAARKGAEEEAARSEASAHQRALELQIVTDTMDAPVTRCGKDFRYRWVNRHYAQWLERGAEEIVGRPIEDVIGAEAMQRLRPHFDRVLRGEVVRYEDEVDFRGIGRRWIQAVYTPTFDPDGGVDGWVAVVVDIQARKEAEEQLRAADARKERFLATLAHELRNPLAPLRNALEILKHPGVSPSTAEAARATMERQLSHAVRLVDDLLDVSRINRDALELRLETCDIGSVVAQAVETVRPFVEAGGHPLRVSLPDGPLVLRADPVRLAQMISNLIHNSCKFSDPGKPIYLSARKDAGRVVISVRDEGIGFVPEDRERLFEMFTQLAPAPSRSRDGLGVGLSIVRRLAEMHGGRVEASSDGPGRGSEFRVTLQDLALSPSAAAPFPKVAPAPAAARRILVVDDNADSASSLAALLELSGNQVRTGHDGLDAVRLAEEFSPDVVLLDIGLPGIDGYEAARRIRELPRGRSILLVAVTGWGQSEDRRRSREAGFDHHMVKPLRAAALETLLANFSGASMSETGKSDGATPTL
jgi:two-component system CheB/CheR fusion protein